MISELLAEGNITFPCLIARSEIGRSNKNVPYLSFDLQDSSAVLDARYWNLTEEEARQWKEGMVVEVSGELKRYRNAWQLRVFSIRQIEGNPVDYTPSAPLPRQSMEEEINRLIDGISSQAIHDIVRMVLDENWEDFFTFPAAVRNHHHCPGGLAWHTLAMAHLAQSLLDLYEWLNYDLLIGGVLLHDAAKVEEYTDPVVPEYSTSGNLVGHISLGAQYIDRAAMKLGLEDSEEAALLKHMVLSHHGKHEYGSPVLPMIPEAEALSAIDNLDARLFMIHETVEVLSPGTFSQRNPRLDNRMFYRKSWDDDSTHRPYTQDFLNTQKETAGRSQNKPDSEAAKAQSGQEQQPEQAEKAAKTERAESAEKTGKKGEDSRTSSRSRRDSDTGSSRPRSKEKVWTF